eukprot:17058_1
MGNKNSVVVQISNGGQGTAAVYPGTAINGQVHLNFPEGIEIGGNGISLSIRGKEGAKWTEKHSSGTGKNRRTHTRHRHVKDTVLDGPPLRLESVLNSSKLRGQYTIPFSLFFPAGNYPPTFRCPYRNGHAYVSYHIKAKVHVSGMFSRDLKNKSEFFVAPLLPNQIGTYMQPQKLEHDAEITVCCCLNRGSCTLCSEIPRSLVTGSDELSVRLRVENRGKKAFPRSEVKVVRVLRVSGQRTDSRTALTAKDTQPIQANSCTEEREIPIRFDIPEHQSTFNSKLLSCNFKLQTNLPVRLGRDIKVEHDLLMLPRGFQLPRIQSVFEEKLPEIPPSYGQSDFPPEISPDYTANLPPPPVYSEGTGTNSTSSAPPPDWTPEIQATVRWDDSNVGKSQF